MINETIAWLSANGLRGISLIIALFALVLIFSELRVYLKHNSSIEYLVLWSSIFIGSALTFAFNDVAFGFFMGLTVLMVWQTYELRDVPVWNKLMLSATISYVVVLIGKIVQMVYNFLNGTPKNEQFFSASFTFSFIVFIIFAYIFFGKKFILVSRFSSPQIVYLLLFGLVYVVFAYFFKDTIIHFMGNSPLNNRVIFLSFGIYEILALVMIFMYFISGWLLDVLYGVKSVTDPEIIAKVQTVAHKLGIKEDVKVGFVRAPILNAFAYGPFFDKRIAFISNDLNSFTDSDIKGIVGHELAHASKHHVFILLLLSIFELAIKKALLIPATTYDYIFSSSGKFNIDFVPYLIFSYVLVIFLYVFVRALEGHADKVTKDAGYGEELSEALIRLEGFYQGVAADFGVSVNLLTDKTQTREEKVRFSAEASVRIYKEIISPTRGQAFSNIFVSHPRTSYRISALITDKLPPLKAAFLPYNIIGLYKRKNRIKLLQSNRERVAEIINQTYFADFTKEDLEKVYEIMPWEEMYKNYLNKNLVLFDPINSEIIEGKLETIERSYQVYSPISLTVDGKSALSANYLIKWIEWNEPHYTKKGVIVVPTSYEFDKKKGLLVKLKDGSSLKFQDIGIPLKYLDEFNNKTTILYTKGKSVLSKFNIDSEVADWDKIKLNIDDQIREGSKFIVGFSPIGIELRKDKSEEEIELFRYFVSSKVGLYSKDNYDIQINGTLESVDSEQQKIRVKEQSGINEYDLKRIDYAIFYSNIIELIPKEEISIFTKFGIWWENRKGFSYLVSAN